ncbi:hypothetical protein [Lentzea cavernae]|uniref:Asparagine synthase n=1 Tax=Lentzea cavernae TaxID=2020703 RepID=A0ABQ3MV12_9PSEU|nr:hypothetical protein [Lentzea cavernae]GHH61295.1 hypothetical protein GCM10017774_87040 [Lentzea cavernae]
MSVVLGVVDTSEGRVRCGPLDAVDPYGAVITSSPSSFELSWVRPSPLPLYYRAGHGRLEVGGDLPAFLDGRSRPAPDPGMLLTFVQGHVPPPDASALSGVRRLSPGTVVRVDRAGVTVGRSAPALVDRRNGLRNAVAEVLADDPEPVVAYSGGLASAFVALSLRAPRLVHADLGLPRARPLAVLPGLEVRHVKIGVDELLDVTAHVSGDELHPPMPDIAVPARLAAVLAADAGRPLIGGSLLKDLVSAKLPEVDPGTRGWRLLTCEPFHVVGTLTNLTRARELLGVRTVHALQGRPDRQEFEGPPPVKRTGADPLPWLTDLGRAELDTTSGGVLAVWREHVDFLPPVLGRLVAGLEERGTSGFRTPAVEAGVLGAAAGETTGRIRRGGFQNHLPMWRVVEKAGVTGVCTSSPGHWLRVAAATYLRAHRRTLMTGIARQCALADMGLIDPEVVLRMLADGPNTAAHAMPLLRLVWLERWLGGIR